MVVVYRRGQVGLFAGWLVGWRPCRVTGMAVRGATGRAGVWLSYVLCGCTSKSGFWKFATKNLTTISNRIDRISMLLSIGVFRLFIERPDPTDLQLHSALVPIANK